MTQILEYRFLKQAAAEVGFSACGVSPAEALSNNAFGLRQWLDAGFNAGMGYMENNVDKRLDPRLLVDGAASIISLLVAYKSDWQMDGKGRIAQYVFSGDYHTKVKGMLYRLTEILSERYPSFEARAFVDTAPISDKHWAVRAGLGWIGKNTLLINPDLGSFCFIGELVTTAIMDHYDKPLSNAGCDDCRKCVDACPNGALVLREANGAYMLDANRCTSYNTIENREATLPDELVTRGFVFGCDICQQVCPYNQQAPVAVSVSEEERKMLKELAQADESTFKKASKNSALSRIKYSQWRRNVTFEDKSPKE